MVDGRARSSMNMMCDWIFVFQTGGRGFRRSHSPSKIFPVSISVCLSVSVCESVRGKDLHTKTVSPMCGKKSWI